MGQDHPQWSGLITQYLIDTYCQHLMHPLISTMQAPHVSTLLLPDMLCYCQSLYCCQGVGVVLAPVETLRCHLIGLVLSDALPQILQA